MPERRIPVRDLTADMFVVAVLHDGRRRDVNSRLTAAPELLPAGTRLAGPRGGGYVLRRAGEYARLPIAATHRPAPVARMSQTAVIVADDDA